MRYSPRMATPTPRPAKPPTLKIKTVAIDSITPDPVNVREHNERSIAAIAAALEEFGQQKPIVVGPDSIIVAGSGTWTAAKRLNWSSIDIVITSLTGEAARAYAIADNRLGELSYFDDTALAAQLAGLDTELLAAVGFDEPELTAILSDGGPIELQPFENDGTITKRPGVKRPITVRVLVAVSNTELIEQALGATGVRNREEALTEICKAYLEIHAPER